MNRERPTMLYRLYCADGHLLYIGITDSWERRRAQHASEKPWWGEVAHEFVMPIDGRREAEHAERAAIRAERPAYNIVHVNLRDQEWSCRECTVVDNPPDICASCAWHAGFSAGRRYVGAA